jgi:phosphate transport system substrate-binding protein
MNIRKGVSTSVIAMAIVIVVVIAAAGAYVALNPGNTRTITSTTTNTQTTTSTATQSTTSHAPVTISGAGGTLVYPLMTSWLFAYTQVAPWATVTYASVGSGAGIAQITAGTVDFGESDAPLSAAQYGALPSGSTLLTIPISDSGVVPAYNLPGIANGVRFTGDILARIFLGQITMWNDSALTAINPGVSLPAHAITVVHRSDGSGTMFAFTNYLADSNAQWKSQVGYATSVNWPTGVGCKGNEGVAGCIANTQYSIGPLEIAYEIQNKGSISYGSVRNAAGNYILANITNIQAAIQAGGTVGLPAGSDKWTTFSVINAIFNDTSDKGIYPIATFTYALVYQQASDQTKGKAVVDFLWWVVNSGQTAGANIGYPPLPSNVVQLDDTTLKSVTYNGTPLYTGS